MERYTIGSSVNTGKLCPSGWHVPTDTEWITLIAFLGDGGKLKETGTNHWLSPNTGATNTSGFTALPGGSRGGYGTFGSIGSTGSWWSSYAGGTNTAWLRYMYNDSGQVFGGYDYRQLGHSVRCLKD